MFSFETLNVYQKAYRTNQTIYRLIKENKTMALYAKNQLGRASLSIMLNIAEGNAKFSKKDRKNFYIIARGSAFECAALVSFMNEEGEISGPVKDELYSSFEEISRILFTMIRNLESAK